MFYSSFAVYQIIERTPDEDVILHNKNLIDQEATLCNMNSSITLMIFAALAAFGSGSYYDGSRAKHSSSNHTMLWRKGKCSTVSGLNIYKMHQTKLKLLF